MCVHFRRVTYSSGTFFSPQYCTQFPFIMFTDMFIIITYFDNGTYYLVIICLEHSLIRDYDPVQGLCTKKQYCPQWSRYSPPFYEYLKGGLLNRG